MVVLVMRNHSASFPLPSVACLFWRLLTMSLQLFLLLASRSPSDLAHSFFFPELLHPDNVLQSFLKNGLCHHQAQDPSLLHGSSWVVLPSMTSKQVQPQSFWKSLDIAREDCPQQDEPMKQSPWKCWRGAWLSLSLHHLDMMALNGKTCQLGRDASLGTASIVNSLISFNKAHLPGVDQSRRNLLGLLEPDAFQWVLPSILTNTRRQQLAW